MDLEKLTPAPWRAGLAPDSEPRDRGVYWSGPTRVALCGSSVAFLGSEDAEANSAFIALARNAFDVVMRRGWYANKLSRGGWKVPSDFGQFGSKFWRWLKDNTFTDPFSALVEADRWYRENCESKPSRS
jgi:hypothetical protein